MCSAQPTLFEDPKTTATPKGRPAGKEFLYLRPEFIGVEEGENVRFEISELEEMLESILSYGVQVPLHVRAEGNLYIVEAGHRRLAAVKMGLERGINSPHLTHLPCRIVTPLENDADRLILQLVRNAAVPLTPLEQVTAIERLEKMGRTPEEILKKSGLSKTAFAKLNRLRNAPEVIQEWIRAGRMAAKTGLWVMDNFKPHEREKVLFEASKRAEEAKSPRIMPQHFERKTVEANAAKQADLNAKRYGRLVRQCADEFKRLSGRAPEVQKRRKVLRALQALLDGTRTLDEAIAVLVKTAA